MGPGDTKETIQKTMDLSLELCTAGWNTYAAMALPGSLLYKKAIEDGTRLPEGYEGYSFHAYDLKFLRTIPGSIGGALKMNAGCYGRYISDYFISANAVNRSGELVKLDKTDVSFSYRNTALSADLVIVNVTFAPPSGEVEALHEKMRIQKQKRDNEPRGKCKF